MWVISPLTCVSAILIKKYTNIKLDIPGFVYALYTTVYSHYIYFLCRDMFLPNELCVNTTNVEHIYWMTHGFSLYELYSSIPLMKYGYIIHGVALFIGSTLILYNNYFYYPIIFYLMEISTIFLNLLVYKNIVFKLLFATTFLIYRWLILLPYFIYISDKLPTGILMCGSIFNGLNLYWGTKIIHKLYKLFNDKKIE